MNNKFFSIPSEKQQRIINAAYKVFSQNSYKKSPMSEIAREGGISKALLFHYFTNKKDLYLYLWDYAIGITRKSMLQYMVLETDDFFEILKRGLMAKCQLMREYPCVFEFSLKAYYEQLPEIRGSIRTSYYDISLIRKKKVLEKADFSHFRRDINYDVMYDEIFYAVDGYMLNKYRCGRIIPDEIEQETDELIALWKTVYTKSGE